MFKFKISVVMLVLCCLLALGGIAFADPVLATTGSADIVPGEEREVTFTSAGFTLYGTLSIPEHKSGEKLPVCVLVHGSGPADRDESFTDGGMTLKVFGELATGLKKQGFAVLRYDKRVVTLIKQKKVDEAVKLMPDIFVEDARAALDYVKSFPEIDANRVILVGHSEGGGYAPRIAEGKQLAGVVLLAPLVIPINELAVYQLEYQIEFFQKLNASGQLNATINQLQTMHGQLKAAFEMMEKGSLPKTANVMGATVEYWQRWIEMTQNLVQQYVSIKAPVLFINGTQDLKCPVGLVQQRESALRMKKDLQIVYIEGMIHELFRFGTPVFESATYDNIVKWAKTLPTFAK